MKGRTLGRITLGAAVGTCWSASLLAGQAKRDSVAPQVWSLEGLRAAYCVRFFMEPSAAARELRKGFVLVSANEDQALHPALRQVVQNQPEFGTWIPSNLCFYYLDAVQMGKLRVTAKDRRKAQVLGVWNLATKEKESGARRDQVVDMFAGRSALVRTAETERVRLHEAEVIVADAPDTTADLYSVKLEKTLLVWTGHVADDSSRVQSPIEESWSAPGFRRQEKPAHLVLTPVWSRSLVGALRVEGKGTLAKALKASPIRFVGPFYHGGEGQLRFDFSQPHSLR